MVKRWLVSPDRVVDAVEHPAGKWVKYEDYQKLLLEHQQLSTELVSKSHAMHMQMNCTAAYMRDFEREKARADRLQEILANKYQKDDSWDHPCGGSQWGA
jgi:hypothetical protein